ncbi:MAG TPA: DUF5103 domain-containing protein [Bacteroidales bacterium]|nr:DUF5103 domain-containing protein [Bacteroidales bacterium]
MKFSGLHISILFAAITLSAFSQTDQQSVYFDRTSDKHVKTVQLTREGWNLSYPVMNLNSGDKLILNFDVLGSSSENLYYKFIHCDKDWGKSDIFESDYAEGYPENPVEDYKPSFNTTVDYYNYRIIFPNDRVNLTLSGNYVIVVYPENKPDEPLLIKRFLITENSVRINAATHRPMMTDNNNSGQQVDFTVSQFGRNIIDPYRHIYAFILQNGRWDNAKKNLKPEFYSNNELKYNSLSDKNIFQGGNEFRFFDIKSLRYQSEYVKSIDYVSPGYNVFLFPSESREFKQYFYNPDFNGKYYVAIQEGRNFDTDADYVNVFFTLPAKQKIAGGNVLVSGAFNNWAYNENNLMEYNPQTEQYECSILLKQGYYNYEYAFIKDGSADGTATYFEGSHYETENDYLILIYYRNPQERYDRLLGMTMTNTVNKPAS